MTSQAYTLRICVHTYVHVPFLYTHLYNYCPMFYNKPWKKIAHLFVDGYKITTQGGV